MGPEKHTAYAVQWFAMALALLGMGGGVVGPRMPLGLEFAALGQAEIAVFTDLTTRTDEAMSTDRNPGCYARAAFDHSKCTNTCTRVNQGIRSNDRCRMNTGRRFRLGIKQV